MNIQFYDANRVEQKLYFSAANFNGLFKYDTESRRTEYIGSFPGEMQAKRYLHGSTIQRTGKIHFIPYFGCSISTFDISSNTIEYKQLCEKESSYQFTFPVEYRGSIFLVPVNLCRDVYELHEGEDSFEQNSYLTDLIHEMIKDDKEACCDIRGCAIYEDELYIGIFGTNRIIKINLKAWRGTILTVGNISIGNIAFFEGYLWVVSKNGLTCWKISDKYEVVHTDNFGEESQLRYYQLFFCYNNALHLVGCQKDSLLKYVDGNWMETKEKWPCNFRRLTDWALFSGVKEIGGELCLFPVSGNGILCLDSAGRFQFLEIWTDEIDERDISVRKIKDLEYYFSQKFVVSEQDEEQKLNNFIEYLTVCYK